VIASLTHNDSVVSNVVVQVRDVSEASHDARAVSEANTGLHPNRNNVKERGRFDFASTHTGTARLDEHAI